jgi:hypothetical protein
MAALESTLPAMFTRVLANKSSAALTLRKARLLQSLREKYKCQEAIHLDVLLKSVDI